MSGVLHVKVGAGRPTASHTNSSVSLSFTVLSLGDDLISTGTIQNNIYYTQPVRMTYY